MLFPETSAGPSGEYGNNRVQRIYHMVLFPLVLSALFEVKLAAHCYLPHEGCL